MTAFYRILPFLASAVLVSGSLSSCGSDSDIVVQSNSNANEPGPVIGTGSREVIGTVAVGAPIGDADIEIKCAQGTASTRSDSQGRYTLPAASLQGPCVLRSTTGLNSTSWGNGLVSVVPSLAVGSNTINATPLTHLVSARLLALKPEALFESFDASSLTALTASAITHAQAQIESDLRIRLGVILPAPCINWLTQPFDAQVGDPIDDSLEVLTLRLGQIFKSFDELVSETAGGGPAVLGLSDQSLVCGP